MCALANQEDTADRMTVVQALEERWRDLSLDSPELSEAIALLEAAVKLRKRVWQGREIPLEAESWGLFASADLRPDAQAEQSELLATLQSAIAEVLTPHQRRVLVSLAVNGVPIDVLAERLNTTRGALYKTLHDARRKLRKHLSDQGLALETILEES